MNNIRVFFSKTGRAVYISHLDLYRLFQRAVKRSKLPIWETQGFNPHVYITFALPLALGTEGICESLDTRLTEELTFNEVKERFNAVLPEGIRVLDVAEPVMKNTDIAKSEYEILSTCSDSQLSEFFAQDKIVIEKKTKRGVAEVDLKPLIEITERREGYLKILLPSGTETNISPNLVFDAFEHFTGREIDLLRIKRTNVYCKNGEIFR